MVNSTARGGYAAHIGETYAHKKEQFIQLP
jgi:hypothetical protein